MNGTVTGKGFGPQTPDVFYQNCHRFSDVEILQLRMMVQFG